MTLFKPVKSLCDLKAIEFIIIIKIRTFIYVYKPPPCLMFIEDIFSITKMNIYKKNKMIEALNKK